MRDEPALSMIEPKQKLRNLKDHLPGKHEQVVYDFGKYLAEYLNNDLVPMGFALGCMLALHDLQAGVNGFNGKPIGGRLANYPPFVYAMLQRQIPHIAEAIFPAEFAAAVKVHYEAVDTEIRERRTAK